MNESVESRTQGMIARQIVRATAFNVRRWVGRELLADPLEVLESEDSNPSSQNDCCSNWLTATSSARNFRQQRRNTTPTVVATCPTSVFGITI
ncbi:hypothetical protein [Nocardia sp. CNY236]|uniref:hypothetical protein n=1 Tax=Nocardia sp. CNY236 TaxID=1169152 RepID=UPI0003FF76C8|nr:hypothetical protein [Nocardia sp. CNY236]